MVRCWCDTGSPPSLYGGECVGASNASTSSIAIQRISAMENSTDMSRSFRRGPDSGHRGGEPAEQRELLLATARGPARRAAAGSVRSRIRRGRGGGAGRVRVGRLVEGVGRSVSGLADHGFPVCERYVKALARRARCSAMSQWSDELGRFGSDGESGKAGWPRLLFCHVRAGRGRGRRGRRECSDGARRRCSSGSVRLPRGRFERGSVRVASAPGHTATDDRAGDRRADRMYEDHRPHGDIGHTRRARGRTL
jgi:hypothetical protein